MADGWSRVKRYTQISYVLALGTLVLAIMMLYSLMSPFKPIHIEDVALSPDTVCPAELVGVDGSTNLDSGKYSITIDPLWIKLDGKKYLDEAQVDGDIKGPITDSDAQDELVYVSPPEVGDWLIRFEISVQGRNLILPRTQELTVDTNNVLHVVDCGETYKYEDKQKR